MNEIKNINKVKNILSGLRNLEMEEYEENICKLLNDYVDSEISYKSITDDSTKGFYTLKDIKERDKESEEDKIKRIRDNKTRVIKTIKEELEDDDLDDKILAFPLNELSDEVLDKEQANGKAWFYIKTSENRIVFLEK